MKKVTLQISFLYFLILLSTNLFAQDTNLAPLSNKITLGVSGGISKGETDYPNSDFGLQGSGNLEYFFSSNSQLFFGLQLAAGYTSLNGRYTVQQENSNFDVSVISLGLGGTINYAFRPRVMPFIGLELQNLWVRNETAINFAPNFGIRYLVNDYFAVKGSISLNFVDNDNIDNMAVQNTNNDYFTNVSVGISYALNFKSNNDFDEDGILDDQDLCPNEAEDFDGFNDNDGCPDIDNDGDGLLDINDKCPDEAEDFDGFQDYDGCADLDNDNDAIPDSQDECPDAAEDFDGFQDEDGCPDLDNDNDGILDVNDKCPNTPETFNSFEDGDGCPDELPKFENMKEEVDPLENASETNKSISANIAVPNEFHLSGDNTFQNGTAVIKSTALSQLNKIAYQIKKNPGFHWKIEGHMDNSGSPFAIQALSTARANAVMEYLVSSGISQNTFEVAGLGDKYPASANSSESGRKKNRRVVIKRIR